MSEMHIPLKLRGEQIGMLIFKENDELEVELGPDFHVSIAEIRKLVDMGFVFGLNISPILNPAVDGRLVSRLEHEKPITEVGGFHPSRHPNVSNRHTI